MSVKKKTLMKAISAFMAGLLVVANSSSLSLALTVKDGENVITEPDGTRWIQTINPSNEEETEWNNGVEYQKECNIFDGSKASAGETLSVSFDEEDLHNDMEQDTATEEWHKTNEKSYILINGVDGDAEANASDDVAIYKDSASTLDLGESFSKEGDAWGGEMTSESNPEAYDTEGNVSAEYVQENIGSLWGMKVVYSDQSKFDDCGPYDGQPYFVEMITNGRGIVDCDFDAHPEYGCAQLGNCYRYRRNNETNEITVKLIPYDENSFFGEIRVPITENPDNDLVYSAEDLSKGVCSFASYNPETGELTYRLGESTGTGDALWGVQINFFDNMPDEYYAEIFTYGNGDILPGGEDKPVMNHKDGDSYYEFWSDFNCINIEVHPNTGSKFFEIGIPVDDNPDNNKKYSVDDITNQVDGIKDFILYDSASNILTIKLNDEKKELYGFTIGFTDEARSNIRYLVGEHGNIEFSTGEVGIKDESGWYNLPCSEENIEVTLIPDEGYEVDTLIIEEADKTADILDNKYEWNLNEGENRLNVSFKESEHYTEDAQAFEELIEEQKYAFGDWDGDGSTNVDDLKLGIAQRIYYPAFTSQAHDAFCKQHKYDEVTGWEWIYDRLSIVRSESDDMSVIDATGGERKLTAYTYTFDYVDENNAERSVSAIGTAYLFAFDDDSAYATKNTFNVVMYATKGDETKYFIRNTQTDLIDPVTGEKSNGGALCAIAEYDVGSEYNDYGRNVGIFGNGASLDNFVMTDEAEKNLVTIQGRNEDFVRDCGHQDVIFGKFSYYMEDFHGMKIQGSGAVGNTPAWAFATDPIWGSEDNPGTKKEAIVYFGNDTISFKPVTINGSITTIKSITVTDSSIPEGVVDIAEGSGAWTVQFNSDYYDKLTFTVSYELSDGTVKEEYIVLHRVGIDINTTGGGTRTLMHGTENGPTATLSDAEKVIYATYYYPEANGDMVDLYVNYTWKDGSVTKKLIENKSELNLEYHHDGTDDAKSSDYILYEGSNADAPVKLEVSAVNSGYDGDDSFSGMKFGSGKGVCWNNN